MINAVNTFLSGRKTLEGLLQNFNTLVDDLEKVAVEAQTEVQGLTLELAVASKTALKASSVATKIKELIN